MCAVGIAAGHAAGLPTPRLFVEHGVRRIAAGLRMSAAQQEALMAAMIQSHAADDVRIDTALLGPVLRSADWHWDWFDSRAALLESHAVWPLAWSHLRLPPGTRWGAVPPADQERMLLHTLSMSVANAHNTARIANPANRRLFAITLKVQDEHCPAERLMCDLHRAAIEAYDFSALPPYFPMCGVQPRVKPLGDTL